MVTIVAATGGSCACDTLLLQENPKSPNKEHPNWNYCRDMRKPVTKSNVRYALRQASTVPMITTCIKEKVTNDCRDNGTKQKHLLVCVPCRN
jgi:hypothetical protein